MHIVGITPEWSGNRNREQYSGGGSQFHPLSERIILLQLESRAVNLNVIQVYAPTQDKDQEEIQQFYEALDEELYTKSYEVNTLMGEFNAKVDVCSMDKVVVQYGPRERNHRRHRLLQYCLDKELVIQSTCFQFKSEGGILGSRCKVDNRNRLHPDQSTLHEHAQGRYSI